MKDNPILDKNLACIEIYNPKLKEDLLNIKALTNNIELVETSAKEPNLLYNKMPLHNEFEAETEAKNIIEKTQNTKMSIHVVFGMGLGYLFKEFAEKSQGKVIVYEPNLEILRVTLELVDFSKELSQSNVKIVSDIPTFKNIFANEYFYKAQSTFVFLHSYKQLYSNEINDIFKQIEITTGTCIADYNTLKASANLSIEMMLKNISCTLNEVPLMELKDKFKGKTALIISAGPSLDNCIDTIKKNREKVVIFCVGTAFKALAKNGITPDFLNVMEVNDCSGQVEGFDLSQINLIIEPYTNNSFHIMKPKKTFLFPTNASHANNGWAKIVGEDISQYNAKGTVSYEALFSAKALGCEKIILVGQDLAYVNNQCYSKDSAYSDLGCQINPETNRLEVKIKDHQHYVQSLIPSSQRGRELDYQRYADYKVQNLNNTLYYVKGITGEMLPTQGGYATFIEHFKEFAAENQNLNLINSSMIGADIKGFKNLPLEVALETVDFISERPDLSSVSHNYDKNLVLKNLKTEKENFQEILTKFAKAKEYIYKYTREFDRQKTITKETNNYFKLLLSLYDEINLNNATKSPLYQAISFAEHIEIQETLKSAQAVDAQSIQEVYEKLKTYYTIIEEKLVKILSIIKEQETLISSNM